MQNIRIVIVDDRGTRNNSRQLLSFEKYRCYREAENGRDAIDIIKKLKPILP